MVKRHNPKTGDMTNIILYCTVLLAAVLGLLVALIKKHNR
ncbi:sortase B protein-sorting domain-containing protein [Mogibacterium pumilum]